MKERANINKKIDWETILSDVEKRSNNRQDFVISTDDIKFGRNNGHIIGINNKFQTLDFPMNPWAQSQFFNKLNMPGRYFKELMEENQFDMVAEHANYQLGKMDDDDQLLVRTIDHGERFARAILTDRYSPFDNDQLIDVVNEALNKSQYKYEIIEYQNDDLTASIRITFPDTETDIDYRDRKQGDVLKAAVMIMNSEVGKRGIYIMPVVYRVVCSNGLTVWKTIGSKTDFYRKHVGLTDQGVYDFAITAFEQAMDTAYNSITRFKDLQKINVEDPEIAIKNMLSRNKIPKRVIEKVQERYDAKWMGDKTMFAVVNAMTNVARDLDIDDKMDLETAAGNILANAV
ncbi:MAG: DUF932 domain-containing protein [Candidatus Woesearchaeota archaeon]